MVEQGLFELITQDVGVSALVGAKAYWILAPKGATLPYLILSRVNTADSYDFNGAKQFREGLFQISCFATDYYSSKSLGKTVRSVLQSFIGNLPDSDSTGVAAVIIAKDWDMQYEEGGRGFVYCNYIQFRVSYYDNAVSVPIDGGSF